MQEALDALEAQIRRLRQEVRAALTAHQSSRASELRAGLRRAVRAWDVLVDPDDPAAEELRGSGSLLPVRAQVHQAPDTARRACGAQADLRGSRSVLRRPAGTIAPG
jgi:hypothetical protein